jgi:hypothetical protein
MLSPDKRVHEWDLRSGRAIVCRDWGGVHLGHLWQWPLTIDCRTNMKLKPTGEFTVICARCKTHFRTGPLQ